VQRLVGASNLLCEKEKLDKLDFRLRIEEMHSQVFRDPPVRFLEYLELWASFLPLVWLNRWLHAGAVHPSYWRARDQIIQDQKL
jgi:hypothetical protein